MTSALRVEENADSPDTNPRALREELEDFVLHEARLLDEHRYEEWSDLFAADGVYWVPAIPNQESPATHVSLFYDDKASIKVRVSRLRHPLIHVQTPASRVCHVLSRVMVMPGGRGLYNVECSFSMLEYRLDLGQRIYGGRCLHALRRNANGFEIVMKRVDLINCDGVFPALAVPF